MEVTALLRHLRISPRKVRLVVNSLRGLAVPALPISKLIQSAVANAEQNYHWRGDQLWIKSLTVGDGVTLHRWTPRAMGRATPIHKRASHIKVILTDKAPTKAKRYGKKG